jgi:hypothetical protein
VRARAHHRPRDRAIVAAQKLAIRPPLQRLVNPLGRNALLQDLVRHAVELIGLADPKHVVGGALVPVSLGLDLELEVRLRRAIHQLLDPDTLLVKAESVFKGLLDRDLLRVLETGGH